MCNTHYIYCKGKKKLGFLYDKKERKKFSQKLRCENFLRVFLFKLQNCILCKTIGHLQSKSIVIRK